jgi:CDP-6-deoxy-D-xylo-4-hexulose-3-dehydrase
MQPGYTDMKKRVVGDLLNTDFVMKNTFFLGTYPGITSEKIEYVLDVIKNFLGERISWK